MADSAGETGGADGTEGAGTAPWAGAVPAWTAHLVEYAKGEGGKRERNNVRTAVWRSMMNPKFQPADSACPAGRRERAIDASGAKCSSRREHEEGRSANRRLAQRCPTGPLVDAQL